MQKSDKPGYVYILTNPSFRNDRIKIGKSKNPVNVRSKQLFNTAIPTPFEIYATIRTTKFNEVETMLHNFIDLLTNTRVNQKREFFDILPEKALEIFKIIYPVIDDAYIEIYKNGKVVETMKKECCEPSQTSIPTQSSCNSDSAPKPEESKLGSSDFYLNSAKSMIRYYSALRSDFIKEILVANNFPNNIFDIKSLEDLEKIRKLVTVKEKKVNIHTTYSCSISHYKHYLENGFGQKEFEHDATLAKQIYK